MICIFSACLNYKEFAFIEASNLSVLSPYISEIYERSKFGDKIVLLQSPYHMVSKTRVITLQVMTVNTLSFL